MAPPAVGPPSGPVSSACDGAAGASGCRPRTGGERSSGDAPSASGDVPSGFVWCLCECAEALCEWPAGWCPFFDALWPFFSEPWPPVEVVPEPPDPPVVVGPPPWGPPPEGVPWLPPLGGGLLVAAVAVEEPVVTAGNPVDATWSV